MLDEEESRIVIQTVSELYEETYDQNLQNLLDNKAQFDFMAKMENSEGQDQWTTAKSRASRFYLAIQHTLLS